MIEKLVKTVREHPTGFYRERWGGASSFGELPILSRADFASMPLSRRRYAEGSSLVKNVRSPAGRFLAEWRFDDIRAEPYAAVTLRPLVYLADTHEATEKALWCNLNGTTPIVGEKNTAVTLFMAERFAIDSVLADVASLELLAPYLASRTAPLESITVIGEAFDTPRLAPFAAYARSMRLLLNMPEIGAIAEAAFAPQPRFIACPDVHIEERAGELVVTKARMLATPIIRYATGIAAIGIEE